MENKNKRHGCLSIWLLLIMLASLWNIFGGFSQSATESMLLVSPSYPIWTLRVRGVLAILNMAFAVALIRWKKWGFLGLCITSVIGIVVDWYAGLGLFGGFIDLATVVILVGLLLIGGENKAWPRLT